MRIGDPVKWIRERSAFKSRSMLEWAGFVALLIALSLPIIVLTTARWISRLLRWIVLGTKLLALPTVAIATPAVGGLLAIVLIFVTPLQFIQSVLTEVSVSLLLFVALIGFAGRKLAKAATTVLVTAGIVIVGGAAFLNPMSLWQPLMIEAGCGFVLFVAIEHYLQHRMLNNLIFYKKQFEALRSELQRRESIDDVEREALLRVAPDYSTGPFGLPDLSAFAGPDFSTWNPLGMSPGYPEENE